MDTYEESAGYIFTATAHGTVVDRFTFYGPFSAGLELARKRGALYDATEIDYVND